MLVVQPHGDGQQKADIHFLHTMAIVYLYFKKEIFTVGLILPELDMVQKFMLLIMEQ